MRDGEGRPGVTFNPATRVFRLQTKTVLYAFRVDDNRNLEHLWWGGILPEEDDLSYLTLANAVTLFDPVGEVTVAKILGLHELENVINNESELQEKWKIYTRAKDNVEDQLRSRRLENASWRLWTRERFRGGDLNRDLGENVLMDALGEDKNSPDDASSRKESQADGTHTEPSSTGSAISQTPNRGQAQPQRKSQQDENGETSGSLQRHQSQGVTSASTTAQMRSPELQGRARDFGTNRGRSPGMHATFADVPSRVIDGTHSVMDLHALDIRATQGSVVNLPALEGDMDSLTDGMADMAKMTSMPNINWGKLDPEAIGKNTKLLEFSDKGTGDYREPSIRIRYADGSHISPMRYKSHRIVTGKPFPNLQMPHVCVDDPSQATTLIVELEDSVTKLLVEIIYTVMHEYSSIIRRVSVINRTNAKLKIESIMSATVDFDADKYYATQLSGGWARERQVVSRELNDGTTQFKSSRGTSSHQFNPFLAISTKRPPSEHGPSVFAFTLVYSGNFSAMAEVSENRRLRVNMGINPEDFSWILERHDAFHCPEVIMTYSACGLGDMSRDLHRLMRMQLMPKRWREELCPILINTWEAQYFNVNHENVIELAREASKADIEMIVLDDGWFGERNDASSSLGDWYVNKAKFPFGIEGLAREIEALGMKFGIWLEPEMVNYDSQLHRNHPDWSLHVPTRHRTTGRNQFVLDFSRKDVREYIFQQLYELLRSAPISYVKWDMNRHLTEVFSQHLAPDRQGEVAHRFIMGVYEVLGRITTAFPDILFETCSGGGGRFDAGMLYYSPQIWTSDNTDAVSRAFIQYGTSLVYPVRSMGAHISTVPNHQTYRMATLKTRTIMAMMGTFGFEMDPRHWTEEEMLEVRASVSMYKRFAKLINYSDLFRLWSPFDSDSMAWMHVAADKQEAIVFAVNIRREVGRLNPLLQLGGLAPNMMYSVEELLPGTLARNMQTGTIEKTAQAVYQYGRVLAVSGTSLMNAGIPIKFIFDSDSACFHVYARASF